MSELALRDYQLVARDYLRERGKAGLFLDMGLGKTAISLAALEPEHLPALVVAPKRVAEEVWDVEAAKFRPDLSVSVAMGDPAARAAALRAGADITVIGRDNLRDVLSVRSRPWRTLIVDELSGYKNRASVRWKTARKLVAAAGSKVAQVWGLTGTPSPNGLMDLWAQVYLLDGGQRLGKNITTFRSRFFYPGNQLPSGVITEWIPRDGAEDKIKELISDICLYMGTEGRVELPPVTHNVIEVELPKAAKNVYNNMREELVVDMKDIFGEGETHTAAGAAILTSKLSQISAGFLYVDDADIRGMKHAVLHGEKVNAVREVVEGTGSPVLVFYRYEVEKNFLKAAFPEARLASEPGVTKAWNRGEVPILIAHPASAGHGLNLQYGGHTIVWTTLPWSLEEWQQANKRLARSGQEHPVVIHRVMAKNTIDHMIYAALTDKAATQNRILEYLESPL